jgi:glucosylceramidase
MRLMVAAGITAGLPARGVVASPQAGTGARAPAGWQVVTTAQGAGQRFVARPLGAPVAAGQPPETDTAVFVDTRRRYQEVFGFGGAVTDAVAEVYARLTPAAQQAFVTAYFNPHAGIGYNVVRTSIHSSDFGSESYTYVKEGDRSLASFSIARDLKLRVPLLRQVLATAQAAGNPVRVFASPWSAPAWMKTNGSMLSGGSLLPAYRDVWAQYIVRFVKAYEGAGIPLWSHTRIFLPPRPADWSAGPRWSARKRVSSSAV